MNLWNRELSRLLLCGLAAVAAVHCASSGTRRPILSPELLASLSCPDRCMAILDDCRQGVIDRCTQIAKDNSEAYLNPLSSGASASGFGVGGLGMGSLGGGFGAAAAPRVDPVACQQSTQSCDWNYSYCQTSCGGGPAYSGPTPAPAPTQPTTSEPPLSL